MKIRKNFFKGKYLYYLILAFEYEYKLNKFESYDKFIKKSRKSKDFQKYKKLYDLRTFRKNKNAFAKKIYYNIKRIQGVKKEKIFYLAKFLYDNKINYRKIQYKKNIKIINNYLRRVKRFYTKLHINLRNVSLENIFVYAYYK